MGNILYIVIMELCGALFLCFGLLLWKKEKINLLHDYHYSRVKEEDKKAYTGIMGKAMVVMGIGMAISGILGVFSVSMTSWIPFCIAFIIGIGMLIYGQTEYNRSIF